MKIVKEIRFFGNFQKADTEDDQKIENINAVIYCCANGEVLLEVKQSILQTAIDYKLARERVPITTIQLNDKVSKSKNTHQDIASGKNHIDFSNLDLNNIDKKLYADQGKYTEITHPAYKGKYIIKGQTDQGMSLSAIVSQESRKKPKFMLIDLKINYDAVTNNSKIEQIIYGLINLPIDKQLSSKLQDDQASFVFNPRAKEDTQILDAELTGELTIFDLQEKEDYQLYSSWLRLVLSFASGNLANFIYKKLTWENNIETEHWLGGMAKVKKNGLIIIEPPNFLNFTQQVSNSIRPEIFAGKYSGGLGLGLGIYWYLENFTSDSSSTQFICLCTAFESLRKCFIEANRIRKNNLSEDVKQILNLYNVQYSDMLLKDEDGQVKLHNGNNKLEYVKTRNDIVHEGFADIAIIESYLKLENLFIRLVLSMLNYQGNYIEHDGKDIICRSLPMSQSNPRT